MTTGGIFGGIDRQAPSIYVDNMRDCRSASNLSAPVRSGTIAPCPRPVNDPSLSAASRPNPDQAAIDEGVAGGMALTDTGIRKAIPRDKGYKLADANGLYLFVSPTGAKSFRLKYRFGGKEKLLTFGQYPVVTLARARERALEARREVSEGIDPSAPKVAALAPDSGPTFSMVALDWYALNKPRWSAVHADDVIRAIRRDLLPLIGDTAIHAVTVPAMLAAIRAVEARPAIETAHRARQRAEMIFGHAIASGLATANPAAQIAKALAPMPRNNRQPAVVTLVEAREVYAAVTRQLAQPETVAALQFVALTAQRSGDVRGAEWLEMQGLDGAEPVWRIPLSRMKGSLERKAERAAYHVVPLAPAALAILDGIRPLTGRGRLVFPSPRFPDKPLSDNALGYLLQRAGYSGRHVPHGWRATFSTILNEAFPDDRAVIDLMLAHAPKNAVEAAYNRAAYMARRRELALAWAAMLTADQ
jgi:integrase